MTAQLPEDPQLPGALQELMDRLGAEFDCTLRGTPVLVEDHDMIMCRRFMVHHPSRPSYKLKQHFNVEMLQYIAALTPEAAKIELRSRLDVLESFLRAELVQWKARKTMKSLPRLTHQEDPTNILNNFIEQMEQMMNEALAYPPRPAWEGLLVGIEMAMFRAIKQENATPVDKVQIIAHFAVMTAASPQTDPQILGSWMDHQFENRRLALLNEHRD